MDHPPVEFRILGPTELRIRAIDVDNGQVRSPKRLALLAYLALAADGFRRRDQIVGLLWPDQSQEAARAQLRKAVHVLREGLGSDAILSRGGGELRVDPAHVWCDAAALLAHADAGHWPEALALYRGDVLEGVFVEGVAQEFEEWLADRRRALRQAATTAAWECARLEEVRGDLRAAAAMARRALDLAPDDEAGVRRLIELLDRHGDRAGALRFYESWEARLHAEFGVEPAPETRKLVRRVQAARKGESHETPPTLANIATPRAQESAPGHSGEALTNVSSRRWALTALRGAALGLGLLALMFVWLTNGRESPRLSIAILPLRAIGDSVPTSAPELFAELLTDRLIAHADLTVRATTFARRAIERGGDIDRIGSRLGVAFVVDGSFQAGMGRHRVGLRLVRIDDAVAVWAGSYDLAGGSSNDMMERVAMDIATAMRSHSLGAATRQGF